jgi:diguanylate cyclase (GGDEF)-like protein
VSASIADIVLEHAVVPLVVIGNSLEIRYANRSARALAGVVDGSQVDPIGLVHPDDLRGVCEALANTRRGRRTQHRFRMSLPGEHLVVEATLDNLLTTPGVDGVVATLRVLDDVDPSTLAQAAQTDQTTKRALTDPLTGFPTRRLAIEQLQEALDDAAGNDTSVAVYFLDLDEFRHINDALGHTAGDAMLQSTAAAFLRVHPDLDRWGRIGGDEFLLFVPGLDHAQSEELGHQLAVSARRRVSLGGSTFTTSVSIGVTVASPGRDGVSALDVLRQADIAMHARKRTAPGGLMSFDPEMQRDVVRLAELDGQLRASLLGSGPDLALQPIVNVETGTTYAVEALVRFTSPTLGRIPADQCIEAAERIGLADVLDRHVLRKAATEVRRHADPVDGTPISLSVNASAATCARSAGLADEVLGVLAETGLSPHRLIFEITETAAAEADATLTAELAKLRASGVRIAIDDFGTGYSSLSQLQQLDVDVVKVDRSFLRGVPGSVRRLRYLESIITLLSALGLEIVVEGIEDASQIPPLLKPGVALMQGYHFARPAPRRSIDLAIERAAHTVEQFHIESRRPYQPVLDWTGEIPCVI